MCRFDGFPLSLNEMHLKKFVEGNMFIVQRSFNRKMLIFSFFAQAPSLENSKTSHDNIKQHSSEMYFLTVKWLIWYVYDVEE